MDQKEWWELSGTCPVRDWQLASQSAVHWIAGRREFCRAHFSLLQLTQGIVAWMERNDRKMHFKAVHMKVIPDIVLWRCETLCFSSYSTIIFLFLSIYYLPSALQRRYWVSFLCVVTSVGISYDAIFKSTWFWPNLVLLDVTDKFNPDLFGMCLTADILPVAISFKIISVSMCQ